LPVYPPELREQIVLLVHAPYTSRSAAVRRDRPRIVPVARTIRRDIRIRLPFRNRVGEPVGWRPDPRRTSGPCPVVPDLRMLYQRDVSLLHDGLERGRGNWGRAGRRPLRVEIAQGRHGITELTRGFRENELILGVRHDWLRKSRGAPCIREIRDVCLLARH